MSLQWHMWVVSADLNIDYDHLNILYCQALRVIESSDSRTIEENKREKKVATNYGMRDEESGAQVLFSRQFFYKGGVPLFLIVCICMAAEVTGCEVFL